MSRTVRASRPRFNFQRVDYHNAEGVSVPVLHAQGSSRYDYPEMFQFMYRKKCKVPDWIGIITCCNKPMLSESALLDQLQKNKIPYINPAEELEEWSNTQKPFLTVEAIEALPDYITHILALDALDVMLNGDFSRAFPSYESYGKPVLFGATRNNSPNIIIDKVRDRDWRGEYRYLNAGTVFGQRDAMLAFYRLVCDVELPDNDREQPLVRHAFAACQDWVDFDWRCLVFQTFSRAVVEFEDDHTVRVS